MPPLGPRVSILSLAAATAAIALTGCAGFQTTGSSLAIPATTAVTGSVHGGQFPVSGAHIYLYGAAIDATYAAAATSLLSTTAAGVATDASGHGYVTTDINGNFTITGDYACPSNNAPVYLYAVGGNPGLLPLATDNTAITLMAVLGPCSTLNASSQIDINEVTTVAAITALQQFMTDPVHVGTTHNNLTGLVNSAAAVANIVDRSSGLARSTSLPGNGVVPSAKINAIANVLVPCINTSSSTSSSCTSLFSAATPAGSTQPTDIAAAMLLIAQNPGNNVANLFNLGSANAAFQPTLASAPNDFTIGVTYSGGGLTLPGDVVIDGNGNAWTANCPNCFGVSGTDSIVGFDPQGAILSGATGFTANVHLPQGIAIDQENAIWAVSDASGSSPDQVTRFYSTGTTYVGFPFTSSSLTTPTGIAINSSSNAVIVSGSSSSPSAIVTVNNDGSSGGAVTPTSPCPLYGAQGVAIDPSGNIFVASTGYSAIIEEPAGTCYQNVGGLSQPIGIAIDHSDNLWTVDNGTNNVSEINGNTGAAVNGSPFPGGYQLAVLAIAGDGSVWFANCKAGCPGSGSTAPDNVIHLSSTGAYLTSTNGYQDTHFNGVGVAAIDGSGNLWVSNSAGASLTELLGVAAPVSTPIATASQYNVLGERP